MEDSAFFVSPFYPSLAPLGNNEVRLWIRKKGVFFIVAANPMWTLYKV